MSKFIIGFSVMIFAIFASVRSFSQDFAFNPPPTAPNPTSGIVTADDFKKNVRTMSQKTQTELTQRLTQIVQPALNALPPGPDKTPGLTSNTVNAESTGQQPAAAPFSAVQQPIAAPQPVSEPAQTYTGFTNGSSTGNTQQPTQPTGKFNIQY